jgi:negative regulator of flagellin synthesis FlgM
MKITKSEDSSIYLVQQYQKTDADKTDVNTKALGSTSASPEEKVNLSAAARDIQQMKNTINQLPEVRTDKVQELQKKIETGTYQVDSGKLAEKMVGESLLDIMA